MQAITIKELYDELKKEIDRGHGDYTIFVTDDEEGNGYHAVWYLGETPADMDDDIKDFCEENNSDIDILDDKEKSYYLG